MSTESLVRPGLTTPFTGNLAQIKIRLRKKVPKLTSDDVRRARIPYYEAITSELYEAGFVNAAFLVLHLIEYEDLYIGRTSFPGTESRRLRYNAPLLSYLREALANAEDNKQRQSYDEEIYELLSIARKLELDREKRWLARQFHLIALDRCADCNPTERLKIESFVRYYYAKFLIQQRNHLEAMKQLERVDADLKRAVNVGAEDWITLDEDDERLIVAVSGQLFLTNRQLAEDCKDSPSWIALQYIRDAHNAALKTQKFSIMAESYAAYGDVLFADACYEEAVVMYKNAIEQASLAGEMQDLICSAAIAQASCYHRLTRPVDCEAMFQRIEHMTRDREHSLCRAGYYYTSASLQLENAPADPAHMDQLVEQLRLAANIFRSFAQEEKSIAARCLGALVRAEDDFGEYVTQLQAAISTSDDELYRVIDWVGL
ncbi:uncharacterized protein LOC128728985 [Anopheles nili]|uniref:uncharacterized protein LOC128728985 n=1 Tax=Anopheles nili TaxID=185578 RepID=UPI00237C195C|nr:uncharacterized protein LOC128728985 [Anopheles nili]